MSYLLKDPGSDNFEVWATNRWSHVCLSYQKMSGYMRVVKVYTYHLSLKDESHFAYNFPGWKRDQCQLC